MGMSLRIEKTSNSEVNSTALALSACVTLDRLSPALALPMWRTHLARPVRRVQAWADFSVWESISISGTTRSPPEAVALKRTFTYQVLHSRALF